MIRRMNHMRSLNLRDKQHNKSQEISIGGKYDELGKKQTLFIVKSVEFGVYLAEDMHADTKHQVLLPAKQVPAGKKDGDKIEVFIYKDSQDRLIATTNEPKLTVGEVGLLKVKLVTKIGAP